MIRKIIQWILLLCILAIHAGDTTASTTFTLAFLGDIMLGRGVAQVYANGGWENAFIYLSPALQQADLAVANLESPLSESFTPLPSQNTEKTYNLCAPSDGIRALRAAGLDVLTLTNNHRMDCGEASIAETARLLHAAGLKTAGETMQPVGLELRGQEIALFAFDDISSPMDIDTVLQSIRQTARQGKRVVVSIHWGMEYHPGTDERQHKLAQKMADAGADLVIGHHPHVLQKIEWLYGEGQPHPTLVAYSLGNALFDQSMPDTRRSVILFVRFNIFGVQDWLVLPYEIDYPIIRCQPLGKIYYEEICRRLSGEPACVFREQLLNFRQ